MGYFGVQWPAFKATWVSRYTLSLSRPILVTNSDPLMVPADRNCRDDAIAAGSGDGNPAA